MEPEAPRANNHADGERRAGTALLDHGYLT